MTAPGPGHPSARHGAHAICGGINSVLLATSVKDALWMGYLLLFIIKAPAQQWGPLEPELGPSLTASPPLLPVLLPTLTRGWRSSLRLRPSQKGAAGYGPQACTPTIYGEPVQCLALPHKWAVEPVGHGWVPRPSSS